jgi:hypothetical protein
VYRFDRDTDGNGIFDEPARRPDLALVSAVDAGRVEAGVPVAGDASSWAPAVNADGSQVAFVTDASNLLPSRRGGGGDPADGDLLVAEFHLGQIRRVLDGADATDVPGAHGRPALSKTGAVVAFETMAGAALDSPAPLTSGGGRAIVAVSFTPRLSLAALDFGTVLLGFESTELYATVLNAGPAAFEPTDVRTSSPNFRIKGGSCFRGIIVAAGTSCSVRITFNPSAPRGFLGELTVVGNGPGAPRVSTELRGAAGEPALLANPGGVDLDDGIVGVAGDRVAIDVTNIGFIPVTVSGLDLGGANPDDFRIVSEACTGRALNPDASCAVEIQFVPRGPGYRSALLLATATTPIGRPYTAAVVGGFARYDPVFLRDENTPAQPGGQIGIGGSGFPADSTVTIAFKDGGAPFATVEANSSGTFLAQITIPARVRSGPRTLIASAPGGVVAELPVDLGGRRSRQPACRRCPATGWADASGLDRDEQPGEQHGDVAPGAGGASGLGARHRQHDVVPRLEGQAGDPRLELVGAAHLGEVPRVQHLAVAQQLGGADVAVGVLEHRVGEAEAAVGLHRDRFAALLGDADVDGDAVVDRIAEQAGLARRLGIVDRHRGGGRDRGLGRAGVDLGEPFRDGAVGGVVQLGLHDRGPGEPDGHDCSRRGEQLGDRAGGHRGRLDERGPAGGGLVFGLGGLDLEVELAFAAAEEAVPGARLEAHQAAGTRSDADRGRVERAVDAVARIDEVEPAAREVVAVVLDHELERGPAAATLERLEDRDPPVVEGADGDDRLGDHGVVG